MGHNLSIPIKEIRKGRFLYLQRNLIMAHTFSEVYSGLTIRNPRTCMLSIREWPKAFI